MTGGLIITHNHCGTPRGVNNNNKSVVINPPGAYHNGGLMKILHRQLSQNASHQLENGLYCPNIVVVFMNRY